MKKKPQVLKQLLEKLGETQAALATACGVSKAAISLLVNKGQWPKRDKEKLQASIRKFLTKRSVDENTIAAAIGDKKAGKEAATSLPGVQQSTPTLSKVKEDEPMLLQNETLTPAARKHFRLSRNPFAEDLASAEDVFMSPDIRFCREAMWDVARNGGFCALVGESGAGKTTLREELASRIERENVNVTIIEPYVLAMEHNDEKGKTLKATQIAEAIIHALDPSEKPKNTPQARFQQLHDLLKASAKAGNSHLLLIEEAHCMPTATLKHLKRFREMKDSFSRLLGILLIGQPELKLKLSTHNPEVREVAQRCEIIELAPLDRHLEEYIEHRLKRVDVKVSDVFEEDAFDAIRAKLTRVARGGKFTDGHSICYPLVVNNLIARAMNNAAMISAPKVNADLIQEAA
jgi:type II secretory pathway predicted ATPase ExeA/DNA-binding XRE family transcriptional regulator